VRSRLQLQLLELRLQPLLISRSSIALKGGCEFTMRKQLQEVRCKQLRAIDMFYRRLRWSRSRRSRLRERERERERRLPPERRWRSRSRLRERERERRRELLLLLLPLPPLRLLPLPPDDLE
jgi:hypothetical protein